MKPSLRPVWAEVDIAAVRANVRALMRLVAPVPVLAVVKADAYGHGAFEVANAAISAGASMLGVALVEEGVALREHGVEAEILVLSEPVADAADSVVKYRLTPAVYTLGGVAALEAAAQQQLRERVSVQLKIDTGMHRVGADARVALEVARAVDRSHGLRLSAVWTHLAVADEQDHAYNGRQLARFASAVQTIRDDGIDPAMLHAANTAAAIGLQDSRFDLVRCGIGVMGIAPAPWLAESIDLQPALSVHAAVSYTKRVEAGEAISYGLRYRLSHASNIVTVPIGYADGVPRLLGERGGEVLIRGVRFPIAGTITMDQMLVDVGETPIEPGEPVVLIGSQGEGCVTAQEWADRVGTIPYEIVCSIGPRVPRRYVDGGL